MLFTLFAIVHEGGMLDLFSPALPRLRILCSEPVRGHMRLRVAPFQWLHAL